MITGEMKIEVVEGGYILTITPAEGLGGYFNEERFVFIKAEEVIKKVREYVNFSEDEK